MPLHVHVLQHVPFEGPGAIMAWCKRSGAVVTFTRQYAGDPLPDVGSLDLLVVMGGSMSVHDEAAYPWLAAEKVFLRDATEAGKSVVGICLGAQLVACAMGARVYRQSEKEIGWFPVFGIGSAPLPVRFPSEAMAFHWHGETFDLPGGAVPIARSEVCEHQAFLLGDRILGLQCHLEVTPDSVADLVAHCRKEIVPSRFVQSESEILNAERQRYSDCNILLDRLLDSVASLGHRP